MMRPFLTCVVLATVLWTGCSKSSQKQTDNQLRYTIRDMNGNRSCRSRASVAKTVGMTPEQVRAWAREGPGDEDRTVLDESQSGPGVVLITIRNARGRVSGRVSESVTKASQMNDEQISAWVKEDEGGRESRSATLYKNGFVEIIWRGSAGQLLYTVRNTKGSRTSGDRASALRTLEMTDEQVKAWVEEASAAAEGRCATFSRSGFVEGISRGSLQDPPWEG